MTTVKRKLLLKSNVCETVKRRVQRAGSGERDRQRDRLEGEDEEPTCSQYFPSKADHEARLRFDFFNQPCVDLAKALLGKVNIEHIIHIYINVY